MKGIYQSYARAMSNSAQGDDDEFFNAVTVCMHAEDPFDEQA